MQARGGVNAAGHPPRIRSRSGASRSRPVGASHHSVEQRIETGAQLLGRDEFLIVVGYAVPTRCKDHCRRTDCGQKIRVMSGLTWQIRAGISQSLSLIAHRGDEPFVENPPTPLPALDDLATAAGRAPRPHRRPARPALPSSQPRADHHGAHRHSPRPSRR